MHQISPIQVAGQRGKKGHAFNLELRAARGRHHLNRDQVNYRRDSEAGGTSWSTTPLKCSRYLLQMVSTKRGNFPVKEGVPSQSHELISNTELVLTILVYTHNT